MSPCKTPGENTDECLWKRSTCWYAWSDLNRSEIRWKHFLHVLEYKFEKQNNKETVFVKSVFQASTNFAQRLLIQLVREQWSL